MRITGIRSEYEMNKETGENMGNDIGVDTQETAEAFRTWLSGVGDEIMYWKHYIDTKGGDYPDDFLFRLRPDTKMAERDPYLAETLDAFDASELRVLDVGAGPLTNLPKCLPGKSITITACDPLAAAYERLLDDAGVSVPVRTVFADAENLSFYFPDRHFHVVHCSNALDHAYDPLTGIMEMAAVLRDDGVVHLGHFENEAEHEQYKGFHQWNFTERDGDFVMWNREREIRLDELAKDRLDMHTVRIDTDSGRDWILARIRRTVDTPDLLADRYRNLPLKYELLMAHVLDARLNGLSSAPSAPPAASGGGILARLLGRRSGPA